MESLVGPVRMSSVVLAELWRGATERKEREFLRALENNRRLFLTPTEANWLESGRVLGQIHSDRGFAPEKLRDLHFDVLIALTARTSGARVITSNRADFEMIRSYRKFELEVWVA
jgi:predicted nucleic acid-binding protein